MELLTGAKVLKPLTNQITESCNRIITLLDSESVKNQIIGQDISSINTPYKYGDETLGESIDALNILLIKITDNALVLNQTTYEIRNNIATVLLPNIESWLQSGILQQYSSIIQYTQLLYTDLAKIGITGQKNIPNKKEITELLQKFKNLQINSTELEEIRQLKKTLTPIISANEDIARATKVIDFVQKTQNIETINDFIDNSKNSVEDTIQKSKQLLESASNTALVKDFSQAKIKYEGDQIWWYGGVVISFLLFGLNLWYVYSLNLTTVVTDNFIVTLGNFLSRISYLSPSLILMTFTTRFYSRVRLLKEEYEHKTISAATLEGFLTMLENNKLSEEKNQFARESLKQIFSPPRKNINDYKHSNDEIFNLENFTKQLTKFSEPISKITEIVHPK